jgi:hypothetical protein
MTSPARLMAAGIPAEAAVQLGTDSGAGLLTATGSTYAGAFVLLADFNIFGTVASGTGAVLPFAEGQPPQVVFNGGTNALTVYPQPGEFINTGTAGASFSVTAAKSAVFVPGRRLDQVPPVGGWIANLSA